MLRYLVAAGALKSFSMNTLTKQTYTLLAQNFGQKKRILGGLPPGYIGQARRLMSAGILRDGLTVLEVGTGWVHWLAVIMRLFYDVHVTLFDIQDNRQFGAFQQYMRDLKPRLDSFGIELPRVQKAKDLLKKIVDCTDFHQVYELLGFEYVVAQNLSQLPSSNFDLIVSNNVLEHIHESLASELVLNYNRLLKQGGRTFNQYDLTDHHSKYDSKAHKKNYLRYSNRMWKILGDNDVQRINRIQRSQWLELFHDAGFGVESEECELGEMIRVHPDHGSLSEKDVRCNYHIMLHKKLG